MNALGWVLIATFLLLVAIAATTKHWRYLLAGVLIVALPALLMGCKPSDTKLIVDTRPAAKVETVRYVPIDPKLTKPCPIAEGPLVDVIEVARARKQALTACNAQLKAISGVEGTPAK